MITYRVTIKREAGKDPLTGTFLDESMEELVINALSEGEAVRKSFTLSKLKFAGQIRRTFVNGEEYFDPRF